MSRALEVRAEIVKLARLLEVDPGALCYLERASAPDLVRLRHQVTEALYARAAVGLRRMAAASNRIPGAVSAAIAERVLGPVLCARLAGMVDPTKALDIAKRLPADFLADIAIQIDPRRANEVIGHLPTTLVARVGSELARRQEYVAMGRFVGHLGDDALRASIDAIDEESLLRIAFVMESKDRLDHVIALLPDERFARLILAADDAGLWPEALDLLDHLGTEMRARFGDAAASRDGFLESLARAADEQGLWDAVLPVVPAMSEDSRRRIAAMAASLDEPVLERVLSAVYEHDLWAQFVPLAADHMDDPGRDRVAQIVAGVDDRVIEGLADAVEREALWPQLLVIAERMSPAQLERVADRLLHTGLEERLASLIAAADETGLWETGLQLLAGLDPQLKERLAVPASTLEADERARVAEKARSLGLFDELGPIGEALATPR